MKSILFALVILFGLAGCETADTADGHTQSINGIISTNIPDDNTRLDALEADVRRRIDIDLRSKSNRWDVSVSLLPGTPTVYVGYVTYHQESHFLNTSVINLVLQSDGSYVATYREP